MGSWNREMIVAFGDLPLQRLGLEERIRSQLLCTRPWGIKHDRLRIPLESPVSTGMGLVLYGTARHL